MTGQENRVKVLTSKHYAFLRKELDKCLNEKASGLYSLAYEISSY